MKVRSDQGATLIETALVLPLLLLLLFGIIEFGRVYNAQITMSHAAREGIREYVLSGNANQARLVARAAANGMNVTFPDAFDGCPDPEDNPGAPVTASVRTTVTIVIPFFTPGLPLNVTGTGAMRCGG